jgi:AraC-like DNA-binding protein
MPVLLLLIYNAQFMFINQTIQKNSLFYLNDTCLLDYKYIVKTYKSNLFVGNIDAYQVGSVGYLIDNEKKITYRDILKKNDFSTLSSLSLNDQKIKKIWLKLNIRNDFNRDFNAYCFFNAWAKIELYEFDESYKLISQKKSGNNLKLHERDIQIRKIPYISLQLRKNEMKHLIVSLEAGGDELWLAEKQEKIPFLLFEENSVKEYESKSRLVVFLVIGVVLIIIFLNVYVFFKTKELIAIINILVLCSWELYFLTGYGLAFEYFWPSSVWFDLSGNSVFLTFCSFGFYQFVIYSLNLNNSHNFLYYYLKLFSFLCIFILLTEFLDLSQVNRVITHIYLLQIFLIALYLYYIFYKKGHNSSLYYFLSFLSIFLVQIATVLTQSEIIPYAYLYYLQFYVGQFIILLYVILFTMGILDNFYQAAKDQSKEEILKTQTEEFNNWEDRDNKKDNIPVLNNADKFFLDKVVQIILDNIDDTDFSTTDLANHIAMSASALYRKIKQISNQSPNEFIRDTKLQRAELYITDGRYSIEEIREMLGFSNASYFTKIFKNRYGETPLTYQKKVKQR